MEKVVFFTHLDQPECMNRLRTSINIQPIPTTMTRFYSPGTFIGNISKGRFWVQKWEIGPSSFFPIFRGSFVETPGGTLIVGKFTLQPFTCLFIGIYICGSAFLTVVAAVVFLASKFSWWMLIPPLMLCASIHDSRKAKGPETGTKREILRFLEETFQAQRQ